MKDIVERAIEVLKKNRTDKYGAPRFTHSEFPIQIWTLHYGLWRRDVRAITIADSLLTDHTNYFMMISESGEFPAILNDIVYVLGYKPKAHGHLMVLTNIWPVNKVSKEVQVYLKVREFDERFEPIFDVIDEYIRSQK